MYLLLIDEGAEIKRGDYFYFKHFGEDIIDKTKETTDLVNLNTSDRFFKKIIAYYPLNSEAKELDLPLLPPFEDCDASYIEKQSENYYEELYESGAVKPHEKSWIKSIYQEIFKTGYKAAQSNKRFSLEDVEKAFESGYNSAKNYSYKSNGTYQEDFNRFIQSLTTQQLPKEFILSDKFSTFEENIKNGKYNW